MTFWISLGQPAYTGRVRYERGYTTERTSSAQFCGPVFLFIPLPSSAAALPALALTIGRASSPSLFLASSPWALYPSALPHPLPQQQGVGSLLDPLPPHCRLCLRQARRRGEGRRGEGRRIGAHLQQGSRIFTADLKSISCSSF